MARIICFGELLMRLAPTGAERLFQKPHLNVDFVGAEANVAVSLSRFGHDARYITTLPDNAAGRAACAELMRHRVDCSSVKFAPGRLGLLFLETGAMFRPSQVVYDRKGSVFAEAAPETYDWDTRLAGADLLHLSGISLAVSGTARRACHDAVDAARAKGITVSFDCNFRPSLWTGRETEAADAMRAMAGRVDVLFANHRDMGLMFGLPQTEPDAISAFRQAAALAFSNFPRLYMMTATTRAVLSASHNRLGGVLATRDAMALTEPVELTQIVDRIGTGDAFVAGILHRYLQKATAQETIDFGVAACCYKHSLLGDFNLSSQAEITHFMLNGAGDVSR